MDVGEFNGRRLYTGLTLDYRFRQWAPTSALCAVSAVVDLVVKLTDNALNLFTCFVYDVKRLL